MAEACLSPVAAERNAIAAGLVIAPGEAAVLRPACSEFPLRLCGQTFPLALTEALCGVPGHLHHGHPLHPLTRHEATLSMDQPTIAIAGV
jgi:hypothetical protein